ncbi:MAG: propionyl-CoA synthetase, partial [Gammaproteobacteria bacterium]|nr:propionyl-CoA synthetase [Gammaproteobacteria bacterium]
MNRPYESFYLRSLRDPAGFWAQAAEALHWERKWERTLDDSQPPFYRWFPGGLLNTCYNAVDRHVATGRADQPALIYDSPVTNTIKRYTYGQVR